MAKRIKPRGGRVPYGLSMWRDEHGVPHIIAPTLEAAHWGMGYCHALDRGIQLFLMRVLGQGRACELLSSNDELLELDRFFRRMNWGGHLAPELAKLDAECISLLHAYCDGINTRLAVKRPWEFWLLGYRPEPWRLEDTMLLARMTGYLTLAQSQAESERLLLELVQAGVANDKLEALFPGNLVGLDRALIERVTLGERIVPEALKWLSAAPRMMASNNWVVAASKSATGSALMANDPHLEINRLPAVWVEQVIELPDRYFLCANMPGLPAPLVGRSEHLAWGSTYTFMDAVDSWVEHCRDGRFRREADDWQAFTVRTEEILRKKQNPVTVTYYENDHGVLDGDPHQEGYYLTTRWTPSRSGGETLMAIKNLWQATTVDQGMAALGRVESSWSWVLADSLGDIGFQMSGLMPRRPEGATGFVPLPGWDPANDWQGMVSAEDLPRVVNPPEGFLVTANQDLNALGLASPINMPMGDYRARRITAQLAQRVQVSVEDCEELHCDTYSIQAAEFMEQLRSLLPDTDAGMLLREWDCDYGVDSRGAVIFEKLYRELYRELLQPTLGEEVFEYLLDGTGVFIDFYQNVDRLLLAKTSPWHGGRNQEALFEAALKRLPAKVDARWGERNRLVMSHLLFGDKFPRFLGFDRGPYAIPGGRATPHQGQIYESAGRLTSFAPSLRIIADLGEKELRSCLAGGPRDRRFSKWYCTGMSDWIAGRYKILRPLPAR
ncbi:MAG: penicillin acylase family protein [Gammaproteobacteria bacterium]|nr:penicillin acylase family protein [Gammaproteobacteria bacterium]